MTQPPPPGWYRQQDGRERYWDGKTWSDRPRQPAPPLPSAPQHPASGPGPDFRAPDSRPTAWEPPAPVSQPQTSWQTTAPPGQGVRPPSMPGAPAPWGAPGYAPPPTRQGPNWIVWGIAGAVLAAVMAGLVFVLFIWSGAPEPDRPLPTPIATPQSTTPTLPSATPSSPPPSDTPRTEPPSPTESVPPGREEAVERARSYLRSMSFSRQGLIDQLEFEGIATADAEYAVDSLDVDWMAQAEDGALQYLDVGPYSYEGLIGILEFVGYTPEEAKHGADSVDVDWNEQAAKQAEEYLDVGEFTREDMIGQLEYEGFTEEQAIYGAEAVGL